MVEDEKAVLEEALDNLREVAQRIRAVSNRMRATSMREDPNHHDLAQHVAASVLAVTEAARRRLGHSDVATTLKWYQQAPDELQERAAEFMGELLFGVREGTESGV